MMHDGQDYSGDFVGTDASVQSLISELAKNAAEMMQPFS
jgi:hypothetical protein